MAFRRRRSTIAIAATGVALAFAATACGSSSSGGNAGAGASTSPQSGLPAFCGGQSGSGKVLVGAQGFAESATLADIYVDVLKACGYTATSRTFASREAYYPLVVSGKIQAVPEYAATLTDFINDKANGANAPTKASGDIATTVAHLKAELPSSLSVLNAAAATDRNAFAIKTSLATANNIKSLSDLAAYSKAHPLTLAGPPECPTRPYCEPGLKKTYGMNISKFQQTDEDGPLTRKALTSGKAQVGLVFSADGDLGGEGLTVLTDDKDLQSSDNVIPLVATALSTGAAASALNAVSAALDQATLVDLNKAVVVDKGTSDQVASQFVAQELS
ncbi:MAG TPA: ABC transporter substrate-binding protein [Mycobacteriales bacterium]|jgi:osmoprotectant transport system substrate-binding protein|nr:ABC transporter substrate-binding protein [Mycobacteriales bacterium]